jgi:lysophospholipase L1-like esterase
LDDDEDEAAGAGESDDSILSQQTSNESLIFSGQEESRILSMEDLQELPPEDLPGSQADSDRKPHYPSWYVPNFKTVKRLLDGDKPVTWMFAGESSASAADLAQGRRSFTDHFSERIRTELGRMLDVIINTSNSGETAKSLLKNLEWRVLRFHPEVVSILLGRKDSERGSEGREEFQNSLEQIVQIVREAGAILVLHTPNRIDPIKAPYLADLRNYVRILRHVAQNYNIPLVDHWEHWKQQKPDGESLKTWLAADGVLPGVYGQREMAKLIFQRFEIFDPNSPICSARVP